jgi:hypothetical protein
MVSTVVVVRDLDITLDPTIKDTFGDPVPCLTFGLAQREWTVMGQNTTGTKRIGAGMGDKPETNVVEGSWTVYETGVRI